MFSWPPGTPTPIENPRKCWRSWTERSSWRPTTRRCWPRWRNCCLGRASRSEPASSSIAPYASTRICVSTGATTRSTFSSATSRFGRHHWWPHRTRSVGSPLRDAGPGPTRRCRCNRTVAHPAGQELAGLFLELAASESGDFSPTATAERALWRDSHLKAKLPFCATVEQVARLGIRPLPVRRRAGVIGGVGTMNRSVAGPGLPELAG